METSKKSTFRRLFDHEDFSKEPSDNHDSDVEMVEESKVLVDYDDDSDDDMDSLMKPFKSDDKPVKAVDESSIDDEDMKIAECMTQSDRYGIFFKRVQSLDSYKKIVPVEDTNLIFTQIIHQKLAQIAKNDARRDAFKHQNDALAEKRGFKIRRFGQNARRRGIEKITIEVLDENCNLVVEITNGCEADLAKFLKKT